MKLLLRFLILILIELSIFALLFRQNPKYDEKDVYVVNGTCVDVQDEYGCGKSHLEYRTYLVMENGQRYFVYDYLWNMQNASKEDFLGKNISFHASNKAKPILGHYDCLIISFGDDINDLTTSIELVNKKNTESLVVGLITSSIVVSIVIILPELLRIFERRYKKLNDQIAEHNRNLKKAKKEALREKIAKEGYNPKLRKKK